MTHIYYIEDDPDIAAAVKEYLERKGFLVTLCATLAQARQALENHLPTLVLLDWNMPDGHGQLRDGEPLGTMAGAVVAGRTGEPGLPGLLVHAGHQSVEFFLAQGGFRLVGSHVRFQLFHVGHA